MYKNAIDFAKKHPQYNAIIHAFGGIALGMFIVYYFNPSNPLIWIILFLALAILGHIYALFGSKK